MSEAVTLPRTGEPPLRFRGEQIAEAGGRWFHGRDLNRWHDLSLYQSDDGRFVLAIAFCTQWQGEGGYDFAWVCKTPAEVVDLLRKYDPLPLRVGFPPRREYADKQLALAQALRQQYDDAVAELLKDERFAEPLDSAETVRVCGHCGAVPAWPVLWIEYGVEIVSYLCKRCDEDEQRELDRDGD